MILWIFAILFRDFTTAAKRSTGTSLWLLHGAIAVLLAVIGEGFFEHNLGDSEVLTMFLTSISCGYIAILHSTESPLTRDLVTEPASERTTVASYSNA